MCPLTTNELDGLAKYACARLSSNVNWFTLVESITYGLLAPLPKAIWSFCAEPYLAIAAVKAHW